MPKKVAVETHAIGDEADPRFFPVAKALARFPGFSLMESKSGALRGMMLYGKSFGMSTHGRFILKLTEERASALITEGIGKPFTHGAGRVMKSWIEVIADHAEWVPLSKEALAIAAKEHGAKSAKSAKKKAPKG